MTRRDRIVVWSAWGATRAVLLMIVTGVFVHWAVVRGSVDSDVTLVYLPAHYGLWDGQVPYRDFTLPYPPGVMAFFLLPLSRGGGSFREFVAVYAGQMVLVDGLVLRLLLRSRLPNPRLGGWLWVAGGAATLGLSLGRTDLPACLCVVAGILLFARGHDRGSIWSLILGTVDKVWPVLILGVLAMAKRQYARRLVVPILSTLVVIEMALVAFGALGGFSTDVLTYHGGRGVEVESIAALPSLVVGAIRGHGPGLSADHGSINLAGNQLLASACTLATLVVIATVAVLLRRAVRQHGPDTGTVALAAAVVLAAALATAKVFSAQYTPWLLATAAVAAVAGSIGWRSAVVVIAVMACTSVVYPLTWAHIADHTALTWVTLSALALRDAMLVALAVRWGSRLWSLGSPAQLSAPEPTPVQSGSTIVAV